MCGIAGLYFKTDKYSAEQKNRMLDILLDGIESRGKQATGFMSITAQGKVVLDKKPVTASEFIKTRLQAPEDTKILLGHTRFATKGAITSEVNNHPVYNSGVYVTHNGVIYNDDHLFSSLKLTRHAEVDSEIISALLAHNKMTEVGVAKSLEALSGSFAIAAVEKKSPTKLWLARKDNPLVIHNNTDFVAWASLEHVLSSMWKTMFAEKDLPDWWASSITSLVDGDIVLINNNATTKHRFTVPKKAVPVVVDNRRGYATPGTVRHGWERDSLKDAVMQLVTSGRGVATSVEWSDRTIEQKTMHWTPCYGCARAVLAKELEWSPIGRICPDCWCVIVEQTYDPALPAGNLIALPKRKEVNEFLDRANTVEYCREQAVEALAHRYKVPQSYILWMLFHSELTDFTFYPESLTFSKMLKACYTQFVMEAWRDLEQELWAKMADANGEIEAQIDTAFDIEGEVIERIEGKTAPATIDAAVEDKTGEWLVRCKIHGESYNDPINIATRGACAKCPPMHTAEALTGVKVFEDDCHTFGCMKETVASDISNHRWCQEHARNRKGLVFDNKKRNKVVKQGVV